MRKSIWLVLVAMVTLAGCATNPVTGKREFQIVGEGKEIAIGQQNYLPSRQMQGGDYVVDPSVTRYVQDVGARLVTHADRSQLPYEFAVLASGVPNAWALPGGKIAINRGLLLELKSEAELAAVLGHEIVHAAARHGAKSMERGMATQAVLLGTQIYAQNQDYGQLIVGGAQLGAALITTRYGRSAELESDLYGMQYMTEAGYNPRAAVSLQETFVRLSQGRQSDFLSGLFASHPPSQQRVDTNLQTLATLGESGELGVERYERAIATLRQTAPAYKDFDKARETAGKGDFGAAMSLAQRALQAEPREGLFYGLVGDLHLQQKEYRQALGYYRQSLQRNPNFFQPHLTSGIALRELGDTRGAETAFKRSIELLPTATAYHALGTMALQAGRRQEAVQYLQGAAGSNGPEGQDARRRLAVMELESNPSKYLEARVGTNAQGYVVVQVGNRSPVTVGNVQVDLLILDATQQRITDRRTLNVRQQIPSGQAVNVPTRLGPITDAAEIQRLRAQVRSASPVQ